MKILALEKNLEQKKKKKQSTEYIFNKHCMLRPDLHMQYQHIMN